jgi:hypothetical protein
MPGFRGRFHAVEIVNQYIRIKAADHAALLPLSPEPPHQLDRVFFSESLATAKSGMPSKVDLFMGFGRDKRCYGSAHRFRPGDAMPFPVGVQSSDLLFGKIDDSPHCVIMV